MGFTRVLRELWGRQTWTLSSLVASFNTLLTSVSSSFLLGFFSIFRYKLICWRHQDKCDWVKVTRRLFLMACSACYLFCQQDGGVAVLLAGLWAQSDEPEQEQRQTGAPDHQLPVIVVLQERFMDVEKLDRSQVCLITRVQIKMTKTE